MGGHWLEILGNCRHKAWQRNVQARSVARGRGCAYRRMLVVVSVIPILHRRDRETRGALVIGCQVGVDHPVRNGDTPAGETQQAGGQRREEHGEAGPGHPGKVHDVCRQRPLQHRDGHPVAGK